VQETFGRLAKVSWQTCRQPDPHGVMVGNVRRQNQGDSHLRQELSKNLLAAINGIRGEIKFFEPLSPLTSFRIGGPADAVVFPKDVKDLCQLVRQARIAKIPIFVFGGTNILVRDGGIRGIVVNLKRFTKIRDESEDMVFAEAGVRMPMLLQHAVNRSLSGLEWSAGIPGTVGGGVIMNAGTRLGEMKDVLHAIELVDPRGTLIIRQAADMLFGYRRTQVPKGVIVGAWFQLTCSTRKKIEALTKSYLRYRKNTQPLNLPNAGSIFKNPPGSSAGRLIEEAGLKGMKVGDAQISPQHANFIVNTGHARAADVTRLIQKIRRTVTKKFGKTLQLELKIVGEGYKSIV
jgi:UDP-N-acetylmuramate dehydrogenase